MLRRAKTHGCLNTINNGTTFYHAIVDLSLQIEICNLDRTKSSVQATNLYKKSNFHQKFNYIRISSPSLKLTFKVSGGERHTKLPAEGDDRLCWWEQVILGDASQFVLAHQLRDKKRKNKKKSVDENHNTILFPDYSKSTVLVNSENKNFSNGFCL